MYDIIFIGDECDQWKKIKSRFPLAKRAKTFIEANRKAFTKMFWAVWDDLVVLDNFYFDYVASSWDEEYIHVFKNNEYFDGICLFPKNKTISQREFDYRFFVDKKEIDIVASTPRQYNIVFISYNEPNADENFAKLKAKFPRAQRVHGVKGIHQAHIAAATLATTDMFWVIDGDATMLDDFKFDYRIPFYDMYSKKTVHVWRSINPINKLEYGYGGAKLLPRELTLNMDLSKTDMTTSISPQFKAMSEVSNITAFNTDPFNTWKSAFRECAKLAGRAIDRQINIETQERLNIWCTVASGAYSDEALRGAIEGKIFAEQHPTELHKINNFEWLYEQFSKNSI